MGKGITNPVVGGRMRDEGVTSALVSVWCSVQTANIHSTVTLGMTLFFVIINNHHRTTALECGSNMGSQEEAFREMGTRMAQLST